MKIKITVKEAMMRGLWLRMCEMLGLNEYAVNEGLMDENDELELSEEQATKLGLLS